VSLWLTCERSTRRELGAHRRRLTSEVDHGSDYE
jgi:hypothetical protein